MTCLSEWQIRQYTFTCLQSKDSFFTDNHIVKNGKNVSRIVTVNCFDKTNFVLHSLLSGACPNLPNSTRDSACNDGSLRLSCCSPRKFFIIILTFYLSVNMMTCGRCRARIFYICIGVGPCRSQQHLDDVDQEHEACRVTS